MSKRKDGVFSLLRHIIGNQKKIIKEQEKQTKILQTIESSLEIEKIFVDNTEILKVEKGNFYINGKSSHQE